MNENILDNITNLIYTIESESGIELDPDSIISLGHEIFNIVNKYFGDFLDENNSLKEDDGSIQTWSGDLQNNCPETVILPSEHPLKNDPRNGSIKNFARLAKKKTIIKAN